MLLWPLWLVYIVLCNSMRLYTQSHTHLHLNKYGIWHTKLLYKHLHLLGLFSFILAPSPHKIFRLQCITTFGYWWRLFLPRLKWNLFFFRICLFKSFRSHNPKIIFMSNMVLSKMGVGRGQNQSIWVYAIVCVCVCSEWHLRQVSGAANN